MKNKILFHIAFIFLYIGIITRVLPIPTIIVWSIQIGILIYSLCILQQFHSVIKKEDKLLLSLLLIYVLFSLIRGAFTAEIYWDWKLLLGKGFIFLLPIYSFIFSQPEICKINHQKIYKYAILTLLFSLLICPREGDVHGRFLSIFYLLIICFKILPTKWKIVTLLSIIYAFSWNFGARSTWLKPAVCLIICIITYFPFIFKQFHKLFFFIICFLPIILLILGITGIFNIFKVGDRLNLQDTETNKEMMADTRTVLYQWVLTSAIDNNYVVFGRTPARGYTSPWFEMGENSQTLKNNGVRINERGASEVAIHNIFTYFGIIGVILYAIVILQSAYRGLYQSSNIYIKGIALFLLFRWIYSWVEEFTDFDYTYLSLWVFIGMCYSTRFREMNNKMFKYWLLSCLSIKKK